MQPQTASYNPNQPQVKQRKMFRIIIVLTIATVIVLLLVALLAPKDVVNEKLSLALARHQEINRVLDEFSDNTRSNTTKQLVATAKLVVLSGASDLSSAGVSVSTTQADSVKITDIDNKLTEASKNNAFDEAITEFITTNLDANRQELESVRANLSEENKALVDRLLSDYGSLL